MQFYYLGAMAVLQQIDDEEKLLKKQSFLQLFWIARRQQFGVFHVVMKGFTLRQSHLKVEDPRPAQGISKLCFLSRRTHNSFGIF